MKYMSLPPGSEGEVIYRWHDKNRAISNWATADFYPDPVQARAALSIRPEWNGMTEHTAFLLKPGTKYFSGIAAPQAGYPGGGKLIFIPEPELSLTNVLNHRTDTAWFMLRLKQLSTFNMRKLMSRNAKLKDDESAAEARKIWLNLKSEIANRLEDPSASTNEAIRLREFRELAESFIAGYRIGSRGDLAEMLFGEVHHNGLLSTSTVDNLAFKFAKAAQGRRAIAAS
jgi:hypothetical protein